MGWQKGAKKDGLLLINLGTKRLSFFYFFIQQICIEHPVGARYWGYSRNKTDGVPAFLELPLSKGNRKQKIHTQIQCCEETKPKSYAHEGAFRLVEEEGLCEQLKLKGKKPDMWSAGRKNTPEREGKQQA